MALLRGQSPQIRHPAIRQSPAFVSDEASVIHEDKCSERRFEVAFTFHSNPLPRQGIEQFRQEAREPFPCQMSVS